MFTVEHSTQDPEASQPLGARLRELTNKDTHRTGLDTLEYLASRGGRFVLVHAWDATGTDSPGKHPIGNDWQTRPQTGVQAAAHLARGGNVGLLTGKPSGDSSAGYLCVIDVDQKYSEFRDLFQWAETTPTVRRAGGDRAKLIVQVLDPLPENKSFKLQPTDRHPVVEFLSTGRQGVVAGRHPQGAEYELVNATNGVPIFTPEKINAIFEQWTGQSLKEFAQAHEEEHKARQAEGDGLYETVLNRWPTLAVFEHFGRAGDIRSRGDEKRLAGNGGLFVNQDRWYNFSDEIGGGPFEAWQYCTTGKVEQLRGREFVGLLKDMAQAGGIPIPEYKPRRVYTQADQPDSESDEAHLPLSVVMDALQRQEQGDAELFAALYVDRVVYDHAEKRWFVWDGKHWQPDTTKQVHQFLGNTVAAAYLYAAGDAQANGDKDTAGKLARRADRLRTKAGRDNALDWAVSLPSIGISGEEWDSVDWELPCENGIIDLTTGQLREETPGDFVRTWIPVKYKGLDEPAPRWEKFQLEIHGGDSELVAFKARLHGKTISGQVKQRIFPVLWGGEGQNGKGTEMETLGQILGPVSTTNSAEVLMVDNNEGDRPRPFLYSLRGKRFVWVKESREGQRLDVGMMKMLSGGDRITARANYMKENVTFDATHTLYLMTNNRPHIPADEEATWKRVVVIEYPFSFVENPTKPNERRADFDLLEKLWAERSGILAWLVRGCLEWQRQGLNVPDSCRAATEEYRRDEDELAPFEEDYIYCAPGAETEANEVYQAYRRYCEVNGIKSPMTGNAFGRRFKKRHEYKRRPEGGYYLNISLKAGK